MIAGTPATNGSRVNPTASSSNTQVATSASQKGEIAVIWLRATLICAPCPGVR